jgi:hypothetical protein
MIAFDPIGSLRDQLSHLPRVRVVDMSGLSGTVSPLPFFSRVGNESLHDIALRFASTIILSEPALLNAPVSGAPPFKHFALNIGMVLAAAGYQLTEAQRLLNFPDSFPFPQGDEVEPAVQFFKTKEYRQYPTQSYRIRLAPFLLSPQLRAIYSASQSGINWQEVYDKRLLLLFDFSGVTSEYRQFSLFWVLRCFLSWVRVHRQHLPVLLALEEIKYFFSGRTTEEDRAYTIELTELTDNIARNFGVSLIFSSQNPLVFGEHMRAALFGLRTQITGRIQGHEASLTLARELGKPDPWRVKHHDPIIMNVQTGVRSTTPKVVGYRPVFLDTSDQDLLLSQKLRELQPFTFYIRQQRLQKFSFVPEFRRPKPIQYMGIPIDTILQEIAARQIHATFNHEKPRHYLPKDEATDEDL